MRDWSGVGGGQTGGPGGSEWGRHRGEVIRMGELEGGERGEGVTPGVTQRAGGVRAISGGGRGGGQRNARGGRGGETRGSRPCRAEAPSATETPRGQGGAARGPPAPEPRPAAPRTPTWRSRGAARSPGAAPHHFRTAAASRRRVMTSLGGDGAATERRSGAEALALWRRRHACAVAAGTARTEGAPSPWRRH